MKRALKFSHITVAICAGTILLSSFLYSKQNIQPSYRFPYKQVGLTKEQAAAHLLSRFTYGATPDQVELVAGIGLEKWFQQQLNVSVPDDTLEKLLKPYDAIRLSNSEIVNIYPRPGEVMRMAIRDGAMDKDSIQRIDKKEYREQLSAYMQENGLKPRQELVHQFVNQKIVRAVYSNNQLQEVMSEFWFNHFNVSFAKPACSQFIPAYERDVIRPNSLGNFEKLLLATAKSPAMLTYLDNFISVGPNSKQLMQDSSAQKKGKPVKRQKGLNENYAREVMELHTLGVDGGYTQADVTDAARVLTGWTIFPMRDGKEGERLKKMLDQAKRNNAKAFVVDGDFLFIPNRHDDGEKTVLGHLFKAGGNYEEGVQLLKILAHHPSTAHFISKKIAVRFVNDSPSETLVNRMAKTFQEKDGDIKELLITMVTSLEFWNASAVREKTKSPFELAISAVRSLGAEVKRPQALFNWIDRMGQKLYYYQAPTGFPDNAQHWINTGSLLNRMNFGMALASERIPGVTFDLLGLNNNHEPESATDALETYSKRIMPERDVEGTIKRLVPLLNDPNLHEKVSKAAGSVDMTQKKVTEEVEGDSLDSIANNHIGDDTNKTLQDSNIAKYRLSQVVGIILGSPEFQRR